jgi:hypothetical protein
MAISHLCLVCGMDLARRRAQRDPHYGLPIVTCPQCGAVAVRRTHPLQRHWRRFLRVKTSLGWFAFQLSALGGLAALVVAVCVRFDGVLLRGGFDGGAGEAWFELFASFALLPIALGAWLTAGLAHWRRGVAWGAFAALTAVLLSVDVLLAPALTQLARAGGSAIEPIAGETSRCAARLAVLAAIMTLAAAGIPAGRLTLLLHDRFRRSRWRARRRRLRATRWA